MWFYSNKGKTVTTVWTCAFFVVVLAAAPAMAAGVDPSCYGSTIQLGVVCPGEQTDPAAAVNAPAEYAWSVFAEINQPAFPGDAKDARRVWETWKSADDNTDPEEAIYLDNGGTPKEWNVKLRETPAIKKLVPIRQLQMLNEQEQVRIKRLGAKAKATVFLIPNDPLAEEVRTNRPAFNFIVTNGLFNLEGQYKYASANPSFDFPTPSKEVKAIWNEATGSINPADYYSASAGGKTYVLVAMHVITKDVPFWHWSSFVHKDQNKDAGNKYVAPLAKNQNVPASLRNTPFANYRLLSELVKGTDGKLTPNGAGAQLDWITRTGNPTAIGNPNIERGFEDKSSCITCHGHASIGSSSGQVAFSNDIPTVVGAINPADFKVGAVVFYPMDFLWSLRNAHHAQQP